MRMHVLGASGVEVAAIGQGTWDLPESGARLDEAKRALRRGIELGMTHIDTAEMYGDGRVEEIVGEAIAGLPRERLFITSKVLPSHADAAGTVAACERSLRRLRTEYLDLYLLHWPGEHPFDETMRGFERLVRDGKVRFVGVSNFDLDDLRAAVECAREVPIVCNQVLYHLRERGMERRIHPWCRAHGIAVVGYTPFGRSRFPRAESEGDGVLARIARAHGVPVRAVVLAFLTRDLDLFTIPKAARREHVEENALAGDLRLDAEEIAAIDAAFPVGDERPLASL